jgi:hypothetical protein
LRVADGNRSSWNCFRAELRAEFDRAPATFSATKLVTLRLLARDLVLDDK